MARDEERRSDAAASPTGPGRSLVCRGCGALLHGDPACPSCGEPFSIDETESPVSGLVREMRDRLARALQGRYELRGLLGHGGMGAVFLAVELRLGRLVAIKVLPPTLSRDEALLERFEREARTAARLDHPGIVPIYSVEEQDDLHFFVMKFVPGADLTAEIETGPMSPSRAREILVAAARALAHAHERGVIHRDVKPSNIMIDQEGRVVLADFGIAKAASGNSQVTATGQALGSPQYMSPEQFEAKDVDGRSDQYGLGMVAYHMLAGRAPFEGATYGSVLMKQVLEYPDSLRKIRPDLPERLVAAVERAIRKDPAERFPDMAAFADALEGGSASGGDAPPAAPTASRVPRRAVMTALAVMAVVAAGYGLRGVFDPTRSPADDGLSGTPEQSLQEALARQELEEAMARQEEGVSTGTGSAEGAPPGATEPVAPNSQQRPADQRTDSPSGAAPDARDSGPAVVLPPPEEDLNGLLTVNAQPVFAFVEVDGVELPNSTPIFRHPLRRGTHVLTIRREGFVTVVDTVEIRAGNETRRSYVLIAN